MDNFERIVHLDLKGAPPKISYLEKLFVVLRSWGVTGLLVEWEDTFPYSGDLLELGSLCRGDDAPYSLDQVQQILQLAHDNNLSVMPLVQTAGHMEWVLKSARWRRLRELPQSPSCLCPSHEESLPLVCSMLAQVLRAHPASRYVHIGADEVWYMGACEGCAARAAQSAHGTAGLYLQHVTGVVSFLRDQFPHVHPVMWDDMLRAVPLHTLQHYNMGESVQPMVWNYSPRETFHLGAELWQKYAELFPEIWVASAFKGASGSCKIVPPIGYHASNQAAWRAELQQYGAGFRKVRGVAFTGWSRYDHYATLCELLPVGLPSLAHCLLAWSVPHDRPPDFDVNTRISHMLGGKAEGHGTEEAYPGSRAASAVQAFVELRTICRNLLQGDTVQTWLNSWQLQNNFTNPMQIQHILPETARLLAELTSLEARLHRELNIVLQRGSEEWLGTNVEPLRMQLQELKQQVQRQLHLQEGDGA